MIDNLKIEILKKLNFFKPSESDYWKYKILSYLHDPPEKMVYINGIIEKSHEDKAKNYMEIIDKSLTIDDNIKKLIDKSDKIAAGIDRGLNLTGITDFQLQRVNPISGNKYDIFIETENLEEIIKNIFNEINNKFSSISDLNEKFKKIFYYLYLILPQKINDENKNFDPYNFVADTRIPDHSIFDHMIATSAVATSLNNISFLLFSLGPVHSFIQTSRKTQDIFMGSYLISYLSFQGILSVVNLLGPDHIIYPDLRVVPLFKEWVKENIFKDANELIKNYLNVDDKEKRIANIPNEFLCIIPTENVEYIANEITHNINEEWKKIINEIKEEIKNKLNINNGYFDEIWMREKDSFPEIYWVSLPWVQDYKNENDINEYIEMIKSNFVEDFYFYDYYKIISSDDNKFKVNDKTFIFKSFNAGNLYSLYHLLLDKLMGSRKFIRNINKTEEPVYKCDICGEREVLHLNKEENYNAITNFWDDLRKKFKYNFKKNEKLCAVCTTKRLAQKIYFKDKFGEEEFPPTSEFANVEFKKKLYEKIPIGIYGEFIDYLNKIPDKHKPIPKLENDFKNRYPEFSKIDPLFFDEGFINSEKIINEYPEISNEILNDIRKEFNDLKKGDFIPSLGKYFAIIYMDGDNLGDWIAGLKTPDLTETINKYYFEKLKELDSDLYYSLTKKINWIKNVIRGDGKSPKPISAAIHREISRRLSEFSINETRKIVEEKNYGKLIYSGGDDVMAFISLNSLLDVIKELRNTYVDEKYMGSRATASMGIVIGHFEEPLSFLIEELNKALNEAKINGRDRYTIKIIKRSGIIKDFTLKWYVNGDSSVDLLKEITFLFSNKVLSSNFPYDLEIRNFVDYPDEMLEDCFNKIWKRNTIDEAKDSGRNIFKRVYSFFEDNIKINRNEGLKDIIEIFILGRFLSGEEVVE